MPARTPQHTKPRKPAPHARTRADRCLDMQPFLPGGPAPGVPLPCTPRMRPAPLQTPNVTGASGSHSPGPGPTTYPHLGGCGAKRRAGGCAGPGPVSGLGAGSVRASVRPSARPCRICGAAAAATSSYARAWGGPRWRPIRGAAGLTDGPPTPPPVLQLSSPPPPLRKVAAEKGKGCGRGDPGDPRKETEGEARNPLIVPGKEQGGVSRRHPGRVEEGSPVPTNEVWGAQNVSLQ